MRSLLVATLVGICGSILFEALNKWAGWLTPSDPKRWVLLGVIFVVLFLLAAFVDRNSATQRTKKNLASHNESEKGQKIELDEIAVSIDSDTDIASGNKAKEDQSISIGKINI